MPFRRRGPHVCLTVGRGAPTAFPSLGRVLSGIPFTLHSILIVFVLFVRARQLARLVVSAGGQLIFSGYIGGWATQAGTVRPRWRCLLFRATVTPSSLAADSRTSEFQEKRSKIRAILVLWERVGGSLWSRGVLPSGGATLFMRESLLPPRFLFSSFRLPAGFFFVHPLHVRSDARVRCLTSIAKVSMYSSIVRTDWDVS